MPRTYVSFRFVGGGAGPGFTGYIPDRGGDLDVNTRFVLPPDLTDADADAIVAAVGGVRGSESVPCSEAGSVIPRKLVFIRRSGNTMSVAYRDRSAIQTVATTVRDILNGAAGGTANEVVCIKSEGEYFYNLFTELGGSYVGTTQTHNVPRDGSALKQPLYSGIVTYTQDWGNTTFQSVKVTTNDINGAAPPTQLGNEWTNCVGAFSNALSCPTGRNSNPLDHRRYILTLNTNATVDLADPDNTTSAEPAQSERTEVPVTSSAQADILSCGQNLAALRGVYCLEYKGESFNLVHKIL